MGETVIDTSKVQFFYYRTIFDVVGELYQEALIIGIFVVVFGMTREYFRPNSEIYFSGIVQRFILLIVIMMWTSTIYISYELYEQSIEPEAIMLNAEC